MARVGHGLLLTLAGASVLVLGCGSTPRDINFGTDAGSDYIAPDVAPEDGGDAGTAPDVSTTTDDADAATTADLDAAADAASLADDGATDVVTDGADDGATGQ
jgi:hypothetical protein